MHLEYLKQANKALEKNSGLLWKKHSDTFSSWLKEQVRIDDSSNNESDMLKWLAYGPRRDATSYTGYIINGKRFHIKDVERKTQNSGVSMQASTMCRSSAKDSNQVVDVVTYYGVLKEIIVLDYRVVQMPLFRCDWVNVSNGMKVEDGFTIVNLHQSQNRFRQDPYILASQAKQVFYAREDENSSWYTVLQAPPRGLYDYDESCEIDEDTTSSFQISINELNLEEPHVRLDCEGTFVQD
ncbi:hypothetical protein UlMin_010578, partial [Ulmus minor]